MSTGGEVANALVCKTSIRRFNSGPVLHKINKLSGSHSGPPQVVRHPALRRREQLRQWIALRDGKAREREIAV